MSKEEIRANDVAQMKGGSSWLNALPLKDEGYTLNKREFFDAVALRYRWDIKRLPTLCVCSTKSKTVKKFDAVHAMDCKTGGFIHKRHDNIRDLVAELVDDVAYDVRVEPPLQPLSGEELSSQTCTDNDARLDVSARGFWQKGEMALFDVKVLNPFAKSHLNTKIETVLRQAETAKKAKYNERVIKVEHASFTPIVMSAFGGYGRETEVFLKRLTRKIAEKHDFQESIVANHIRTKLSFDLVRSQVMCLRGSRRRKLEIDVNNIEIVECASKIKSN